MQVNPLIQIAIILRYLLGPWAYPPLSAILVLLIGITLALTTNLLNRRLIDFNRIRRHRAEIKKWQDMKKEAADTTDPRIKRKLMLKVKRKERYVTKLQGEVGKQQFKPMLVTIIPFILIYTIMNGVFINDSLLTYPVYAPVILSPLNFGQLLGAFGIGFGWSYGQYPLIPIGGQGLFYIYWYLIVSFCTNMIFQRLLKTSMTT